MRSLIDLSVDEPIHEFISDITSMVVNVCCALQIAAAHFHLLASQQGRGVSCAYWVDLKEFLPHWPTVDCIYYIPLTHLIQVAEFVSS